LNPKWKEQAFAIVAGRNIDQVYMWLVKTAHVFGTAVQSLNAYATVDGRLRRRDLDLTSKTLIEYGVRKARLYLATSAASTSVKH
jgi:hypothetical protein